jgi:hypothetical protein
VGLCGRFPPPGKVNEPSTPAPAGKAVSGKEVAAVRDLARRLRDALRVPVLTPEGLGWLVLAGALAAFLPFLVERVR